MPIAIVAQIRAERRAAERGRRRTRADNASLRKDPKYRRAVKRQTIGVIERSEHLLADISRSERQEVYGELGRIRRRLQTKWTPIDTGHLRRSIMVGVTPTGIVARWRTAYAVYVNKYYDNFVRRALLRLPGVKRVKTRANKRTGWVVGYAYYT